MLKSTTRTILARTAETRRWAVWQMVYCCCCWVAASKVVLIALLYFFSEERMQDPCEEVETSKLAQESKPRLAQAAGTARSNGWQRSVANDAACSAPVFARPQSAVFAINGELRMALQVRPCHCECCLGNDGFDLIANWWSKYYQKQGRKAGRGGSSCDAKGARSDLHPSAAGFA